ncbi:type II secretion system F family protein [Fodinicola feengrottensis]|uniref:type II secretion system F family protein n=1 Tax=Fodinicola feengrottensis TaxID=435914 RepID=UPI0031DEC48C
MSLAATAGTAMGVVTGWPVTVALAAAGVWALPPILGPDRVAVRRQQRCEAVATWTESLRDLVSAGAGLHHAITVSARKAPEPIATEISELAGAIHRGDRLPAALRRCGHHLDDRTADLVIATLATATAGHAGAGVARQLAALAATARDQVATRRRLEPQRARVRTSVRIITATSVGTVAFLAVTSHQFLAPYDSWTGQLTLLVVGVLFSGAFLLLGRMGREPDSGRFLTALDRLDHPARLQDPT